MTILWGALGVAAIWMVGSAGAPLFANLNRPQRFGFSFGVGLVWISTMMGAEALIGVPLSAGLGAAVVVGPPAGWWLIRWWRRPRFPGVAQSNWRNTARDPVWWAGAALLAVLWAIVTVRAVVKPIQFWDAWATYAFKAKVMFLEAAIPPPASFSWGGSPNYPDYPLGLSLQEVWVSWFVGTWDDVAVKLLFPAYLLSLWSISFGFLRDQWDARSAMLGTVFVAGLPLVLQQGHDGYTNLPFAYLVCGGAVALTHYVRSGDQRALWLAAVFAAGLVWTRPDGVLLVACNALLLAVLAARRAAVLTGHALKEMGIYLSVPILIWGAWGLVKLHYGVSSTFQLGHSSVPLFDRWFRIASVFLRSFFLEGNWLILWALFALAVVYRWREAASLDSLFLFWPVILYLVGIAALFATTGLFRFLEDGTVVHRLILHVVPLAALWVAHVWGRWWAVGRTGRDAIWPAVAVGPDPVG